MGHEIDKTENEGDGTSYSWPEMSQKTRSKFFFITPLALEKGKHTAKKGKKISRQRRVKRTVLSLSVLRTVFFRPEYGLHFRTSAEFILSRCEEEYTP